MALTIVQYVEQMRLRQERIARKLGVDMRSIPVETRVALTCANAMIALNFRAFSLLGLVTDAQFAAAIDEAIAAAFGPEPPVGPNTDPDVPAAAKQ